MNEREAVHVLAVCSSYDGRKPSTVDAQTWAYELKAVDRDAAVDAVRAFYRQQPDGRIRPGHVLEVLKTSRVNAVSQSSRLEFELLRSIDPDAPDYDRQVQDALSRARSAPAENPQAIPAQKRALPHRPVTPEERAEAAKRGKELARQSIAEATPYRLGREDAADIPENLKRAREMAVEHRAGQKYRDKSLKLGRANPQALVEQFKTLPERQSHDH